MPTRIKKKPPKPARKIAHPVKQSTKATNKVRVESISSLERLQSMLEETEAELALVQPKIDKLEAQVEKLNALRRTKQKLITLRLSIQGILSNFGDATGETNSTTLISSSTDSLLETLKLKTKMLNTSQNTLQDFNQTFFPDVAFQDGGLLLKQKNSLNAELFRAIVLSGGRASTQMIKDYLLEHKIPQPGTGEGFENVPLTDISSRVNYLIRKGLVISEGRGNFRSALGWQ